MIFELVKLNKNKLAIEFIVPIIILTLRVNYISIDTFFPEKFHVMDYTSIAHISDRYIKKQTKIKQNLT